MDDLGLPAAFAITSGLIQTFIAIALLRFKASRPEWGLGWLGGAFVLASLLNLFAVVTFPALRAGSFTRIDGLISLVIGVSTMCALVIGVRHYTGITPLRKGACIALVWLTYIGAAASRAWLPEHTALIGNGVTALIFAYLSGLFWQAHRAERDAGHWIAAVMTGLYPPMIFGGWLMGLDQFELRYWASVPFTLAGLGVMSATMGRLRGELLQLNEALEGRVVQRTQALQDMLGSLESFSSMVSHDVKGVLGGISGASRIAVNALEQGDADKAARLLRAVAQESDKMVEVVSDLLTLARASQAELQKRNVSLASLVHEAQQSLSMQYGERASLCIHAAALPDVAADPGLLRQVLVNLLSNALKFSKGVSEPRIEVRAQPKDAGIEVSIEDNGAGFEPQKAAELFQPFKRLDTSGQFEGSGIGLTIVRHIVERHGGRVWAVAQPGQGATFSFWLPER